MSFTDPIADFLAQRTLAVVGASRDPRKWGHVVWRDLMAKGRTVYPVNPNAEQIGGERVYPNLQALPETVDGIVVVTPPEVTESIVQEAHAAGITRIWLQEGAESPEALALCRALGIDVIHGVCVMVRSR